MTTINSQEDFLRALSENPEWKAAVRAQILGEELLQLPARFDAFVEQMTAFVAEQKQFNNEMTAFVAEQKRFNNEMTASVAEQKRFNDRIEQSINAIANGMGRMTDDLGKIKGHYTRAVVRKDAAGLADDMGLEYTRTLLEAQLMRMLRKGKALNIPANEMRSFRRADLVIEATDGSETHYIVVEASYTADSRDTDRALRNARFLTELTGRPARAAIASIRKDNEIEELISSGVVYWYEITERDIEPE